MQYRPRPTIAQQTNPHLSPLNPNPRPGLPASQPRHTPPPEPQPEPPREAEGVYIISVAARILHMHPQTLRKYERAGLVRPSRTMGMLRLYSESDIAKLRMIKHLVDEMRLNLAGVGMALSVFDRLTKAMDAAERQAALPSPSFEQAMQEIVDMFMGNAPPSRLRPKPAEQQTAIE